MPIIENIASILLELTGGSIPPGMVETPLRVDKAYRELLSGYDIPDGRSILSKTFEDDVIERYNGMVIVKDIPFFSLCEHHLLPFYGLAHIGYIPNGKVAGLSKLARLTNLYARRFQVQERLTEQIADDMAQYLEPVGCMVVVQATHTCMVMRGVQSYGSETITSAVRGVFDTDGIARSEFLSLIQK